jgi:hypothetical protein
MAAIITEQFRRNSKTLLEEDITNNSYYIAIGQQDPWDDIFSDNNAAPFPNGTFGDEKRVLEHLTGLFKITANNAQSVIPKNDYDSLASYKVYDPFDPSCFYGCPDTGLKPCYITVGEDKIFLCVNKTVDAVAAGVLANETIEEINDHGVFANQEGTYDWAYLGNYDKFSSINTGSFVAINNTPVVSPDFQPDITAGAVFGFNVINGGNIYRDPNLTGENTYTINGSLVGLDFEDNEKTVEVEVNITVDSGDGTVEDETAKIVRVEFYRPAQNFPYSVNSGTGSPSDPAVAAQGFKSAKLYLDPLLVEESAPLAGDNLLQLAADVVPAESERQEVVIIPFIAPEAGFGGIRSETLPSWYIGLYADTSLSPFIPNNTKYHQISLIKNPISTAAGNPAMTEVFNAPMRFFQLQGEGDPASQVIPKINTVDIGPGWKIIQNGKECGVIAYIQTVTNNQTQSPLPFYSYYYYTDHKYGYGNILNTTDKLTFESPDGQIKGEYDASIIEAIEEPIYKRGTGEVLFLDNRSGIQREEGQNEELKLIIQL